MNDTQDYLAKFFSALDIQVVPLRRENNDLVFALKTADFEQHRQYLQRWFVIVEAPDQYTVLRERLRGTDQTAH